MVLIVERKTTTGAGELCAVIQFPIGFEAAPFSIGTRGELVVEAVGVADTHLYLRFDGENVLASGLPLSAPALLDGAPLSSAWVMLQPHARIAFGEAELRVVEANCALACCRPSCDAPGAATVYDPTGHQLDAAVRKAAAGPRRGRVLRWSVLSLLGVTAAVMLTLANGQTARKTTPRPTARPAVAQLQAPSPKKDPLAKPDVKVSSGSAQERPLVATPRAAVEALVIGSFESAAQIYRQLAEETGSPVYRLAATLAGRRVQEARNR